MQLCGLALPTGTLPTDLPRQTVVHLDSRSLTALGWQKAVGLGARASAPETDVAGPPLEPGSAMPGCQGPCAWPLDGRAVQPTLAVLSRAGGLISPVVITATVQSSCVCAKGVDL